jgi:DNA-binding NtrC family response regulator
MKTEKEIHALIVENDATVAASIKKILLDRQYTVTLLSKKEEVSQRLKERLFSLAVAGEAEDSDSSFHIMKDIVMASPMTSVILITDVPKKEVDEKAEGYGIVGHVNRTVKSEDFIPLLESFEDILGSF